MHRRHVRDRAGRGAASSAAATGESPAAAAGALELHGSARVRFAACVADWDLRGIAVRRIGLFGAVCTLCIS